MRFCRISGRTFYPRPRKASSTGSCSAASPRQAMAPSRPVLLTVRDGAIAWRGEAAEQEPVELAFLGRG